MENDELRELISQLRRGPVSLPHDRIEQVMRQENVHVALRRNKADKVIGLAVLYLVQLFSRRLAVIEEVITDKEHRFRGYGRGMVMECIRVAQDWGADCVELTCREDSPEVQRFYESIGFEDRHNKALRLLL